MSKIHSLVSRHVCLDLDDRRCHEVSLGVLSDLVSSTIEQNLAPLLLDRLDEAFNTSLRLCRDDWASEDQFSPRGYRVTNMSVPSSNPPDTLSFLARSINSGRSSLAAPTKMAGCQIVKRIWNYDSPTERAMQRWPAAPKAAPATAFRVKFRFADISLRFRSRRILTIRHDDTVILCTHVCLNSLSICGSPEDE